eukprot:gene17032-19413_t
MTEFAAVGRRVTAYPTVELILALDCHAPLAMTGWGRAMTWFRHREEPPLAARSEATWRDAAIQQLSLSWHWIATLRSQ